MQPASARLRSIGGWRAVREGWVGSRYGFIAGRPAFLFILVAGGRELSAIRNVAQSTSTDSRQRGHLGFKVLPVTP
jgi:hypothetical protein